MKVKEGYDSASVPRTGESWRTHKSLLPRARIKRSSITERRDQFLEEKAVTKKAVKPSCGSLPPKPTANSYVIREGLWPYRSDIQEIVPGVCITNYFGANKAEKLHSSAISHVVVCADELPPAFPGQFAYLMLEGLTDNTGTSLNTPLRKALPWIKDALKKGGRVLLHCAAGSSRSGAILVAYIMWERDISVAQALNLVRTLRPIVAPNPGFYRQLTDLENRVLFSKLSISEEQDLSPRGQTART